MRQDRAASRGLRASSVLAMTVKRVTKSGAGVRYALGNASDEQARSWEPKKTSASSSPSPPLTLASASSCRRAAVFDSGCGLDSGQGGLETHISHTILDDNAFTVWLGVKLDRKSVV